MERNGHHLSTFAVETIESIFEVCLVSVAGRAGEARAHVEFPIVTFKRLLSVLIVAIEWPS